MTSHMDHWVVEFSDDGSVFRVPAAEAKSIDTQLTDGVVEFIRFTDCAGSPCIYPRSKFGGMYESTVQQRARARELGASLRSEQPSAPWESKD